MLRGGCQWLLLGGMRLLNTPAGFPEGSGGPAAHQGIQPPLPPLDCPAVRNR